MNKYKIINNNELKEKNKELLAKAQENAHTHLVVPLLYGKYSKIIEYTLDAFDGFVKFDPKKIEGWVIPEPETYDWIIYIKETMEPIGNITADREDKSINGIELAFNTHPSYWRKGYTSEALIEVMRYLFNNGYENVLCGYDEGNLKSKNIGEKLGFLPYKVEEKNWIKDGIPINTYMAILNKQRFMDDLYDLRKHSK